MDISNLQSGAEKVKNFIKEHVKEYLIIPNGQGSEIFQLRLDIIGEEKIQFSSDVTDHYVESNEFYQDQISLKPHIYTVSGEVGELYWYQKNSASQIAGQVAQKLEGVTSFLPLRSKGFQQMKNTVMKASQWVDTGSNFLSRFTEDMVDPLPTSRQTKAFIELDLVRKARMPVSLQTPWGILENYVITDCQFTQPRNTKDKSQISITFKEFRVTKLTTTEFDPKKYQGDAVYERQPEDDKGKTSGQDVSPESNIIELDGEKYEVFEDESGTYVLDQDGKEIPMGEKYGTVLSFYYEKIGDSIANSPSTDFGGLPLNPWAGVKKSDTSSMPSFGNLPTNPWSK